jgi:hypothetical protein
MMYAEVQLVQAKERYEHWLDNEGVTLASKLAEKKRLQKDLSAKVSFSTAVTVYLINYYLYSISNKLFGLFTFFPFTG